MVQATNLSHRRTHNILLMSKLLSLRDITSPLALVLDSLEQPAKPLIHEYIRRAQISKVHVTFMSFETLRRPDGIDAFISCRRKRPSEIAKEVANVCNQSSNPGPNGQMRRRLIIIDSINPVVNSIRDGPGDAVHLPSFLSSLIMPGAPPGTSAGGNTTPTTQTSLIVTYHQDIPPIRNRGTPLHTPLYSPSPLSLLSYMATTIFTLHSLSHTIARKAAKDRSLPPPIFGLEEEVDGALIGHNNIHILTKTILAASGASAAASPSYMEGIVIEMEHRRKSGREVLEWYFLPTPDVTTVSPVSARGQKGTDHRLALQQEQQRPIREMAILLDDHPLYRRPEEEDQDTDGLGDTHPDISTFELGLTERQRKERDAVVLPYFDAQRGDGPGEGGRILYDMGAVDDFDEEEDEI